MEAFAFFISENLCNSWAEINCQYKDMPHLKITEKYQQYCTLSYDASDDYLKILLRLCSKGASKLLAQN